MDVQSIHVAFAEIVATRRAHTRLLVIPYAGFFLCIAAAVFARPEVPWNYVNLITVIALWVAIVVMTWFLPRLECPNCREKLDRAIAVFCPECGKAELEPAGWLRFPRCRACARSFVKGKGGRRWKIRVCTYCGVTLVDAGTKGA